jgi:DNA-3-methyladenine glycosylase II
MEYFNHLKKDKKLSRILTEPLPPLTFRKNVPLRLMASIMSQQLSTKVAQVIYKRFLLIYEGKEPKPQQVLDTPFDVLRNIGLSNAKVTYVQNVASFCMENKINDTKLLKMSNDEIIKLLIQIKGVGQWTVEMLLMFTLGREDVFAVDDLGIQNAMVKLCNLDASNKKELKQSMIKLSEKWSPYRTYACLHLWKWKDGE